VISTRQNPVPMPAGSVLSSSSSKSMLLGVSLCLKAHSITQLRKEDTCKERQKILCIISIVIWYLTSIVSTCYTFLDNNIPYTWPTSVRLNWSKGDNKYSPTLLQPKVRMMKPPNIITWSGCKQIKINPMHYNFKVPFCNHGHFWHGFKKFLPRLRKTCHL